MQKKLMIIAILLLAIGSKVAAADYVSISDFNIFKGQSKEVSITLTNATDYAGFQFDLELPEGITVKTKTTGGYEYSTTSRIPDGTEVSVSLTGGVYRFVALPLGSSINNFNGSSGDAIINLTIQADENATEGAFTGRVKNIKLSNAAGTNSSDVFADQPFTATIRGNEPYAVLSDENTKLTFYYDKQKDVRNSSGVVLELGDKGWLYYQYKLNMTTVVFDESFAGYTDLTTTSGWFEDCQRITSISGVENLKTANVTDMSSMFKGCNVASLDLSSFNTAKVRDMNNMFYGCSELTSLNLNSFNTEEVLNMSSMFESCSGLTELIISNFNTSSVTNMNGMFSNCYSLTNIDVSHFNTSKVTDMGGLFNNCRVLESINLGSFNTANVTTMLIMFSECKALTTLDLSSFNTSKVENMKLMFNGCNNLKTIYVGDAWSTDAVIASENTDNGSGMFSSCSNLVGGAGTIWNSMHEYVSYAHIDEGTSNPGYLTDVNKDYPYAVLSDGNSVLTFYYNKNKKNYNWMKVGETSDLSDKDWLGDAYATSITSVVFDDSFAGYTALSSTAFWFFGLSNLSSITGLNNLKTGNVTNMNSMFRGCQSLTTLDLSGFNTAKVTDMGSMFYGCSGLSTLTLGDSFDTGQVVYMNEMFQNCSNLTELDLGSFNIAKVENMNSMFSGASNLKTIYVGTGWATTLETAGAEMFSGCTSLVGGSNTVYDENNTGFDYARIDGGPYSETPGYFTNSANKGKEVYMVLTDSNSKLTFYYDANKASRSGTVVDLIGTSGYGWSSYKEYITSVEFDPSFADYHGLTSTKEWFLSCNNLATITGISNLNTENVTDMTSMFQWCSALTSLDLGSLNTSNVTNMGHMFSFCYNLEEIDLSSFNTANVTDMSGLFHGCTNLSSLNLGEGFNTENVTTMEAMFAGCSKLTSLDLSGLNTGNVTDMSEMFSDCTALTSLNVSSFNTAKVTDMERMFRMLQHVESLDLTSFNTAAVTNMNSMFYDCNALKTIVVSSDGWSTAAVTDSENMFANCLVLVGDFGTAYADDNAKDKTFANIDGGTANPGYLTDVRSREAYAVLSDNSDVIHISETETSNGKTLTFYCDRNKLDNGGLNLRDDLYSGWGIYCNEITSVVFDESFANYTSLTSTADWFYDCKNLTSITGINNLKTDNVTNMAFMFRNCESLTTLDVSGFKTENVTNMSHMFSGCWQIAELDVSHFNTANVTNMAYMFYLCRGLLTLDVSNFNTSKVTDMNNMFNDCGVTSLDVSNFNTANVTNMENMFMNCGNLTSLDLSNFDTDNVVSMQSMFSGCYGLTSLNLNGFNTAKVTNMQCMFLDCQKLTGLNLSSFNTSSVTNMYNMFSLSSELTTITVGSGWSTVGIESEHPMFYNCTKLVGGLGTTFNAEHIDYTYAHIDGGSSNPGYLTDINGVTLTAKSYTREYGAANPSFDFVSEGATISGTPTITCEAKDTTSIGTYPITISYTKGEGEADLNITYVNGTLTITKAPVTVKAKNTTMSYGDEVPTLEVECTGFKNNETDMVLTTKPFVTTLATKASGVGSYDISVSGADSKNYEFSYEKGTLTISKAPLTITAKSYTIKRGGTLPTFEVEYSGFKNNEIDTVFTKKPVITCEAKADTVPGTYQIIVSDAEAKNYEMKYVFGSLTITDDAVVTANSYSRVYGDDNPTFEYSVDGATLSGTPSITCAATATSPVGTYDIVIAKGDVTNSEVTFVNGTLTITKAPLTITAKSYSIKQGKDLPTLELEYSGLKNNETDTVFTTKPVVSTTATKYSEPGSYDITVKDAEAANYEITFVKGTLTITKKTETYDGSSNVLTVEEGGNIDDALENIGGRDEVAKSIAAIIWNSSIALTSDMLKGFDNPNMLIYVASKDQAPEGRDNVVIDGVASYIRLTDSDTGNNNFYAPKEFTADSIAYTREFKQETRKNVSRGWEGICLPFTVQTFTHESHGEIVPFGNSASKYHFWLHQFTEDGIVNAETIEANKPYLISMPNSNEYYEEFNQAGVIKFASANVKVPVTEAYTILIGDTAQIVPIFQEIDASEYIYALNVSDSILTNPEGSIFVSNYRKVRPFEIYTFHEPSHKDRYGSRIISLSSLYGGNDTTGIDDVMIAPNSDVWYDLSGRRLQSKPSKGGLYIHNGRKIVIK